MIPNKSNFKFQELTPITGVKPYVIRFWETEFPEIAPLASDSGQKIYSRGDVETILKIKKLLFEDKMSIQEAKGLMNTVSISSDGPAVASVEEVKPHRSNDVRHMILSALDIIKDIKFRRNW